MKDNSDRWLFMAATVKWFVATTVVAVVLFAGAAQAQEPSDAELAKKAQNPIANLISLPLQNNTNFGIGTFDRNQNLLNIQPVIPTKLGGLILINRTIVPVLSQPGAMQATGSTSGIRDIIYEGFFTPASGGAVTWGVGPVIVLPSATDDALGAGKWASGPTRTRGRCSTSSTTTWRTPGT
jgi:hypothetical protein